MKKSTAFFLCVITFLSGIILGFMMAPAKQGFGNHSGNTRNIKNYYLDKEDPVVNGEEK